MRPIGPVLFFLTLVSLVETKAQAEGFFPDDDGWIRHWIVYGPVGILPEDVDSHSRHLLHPFTLKPLLLEDFIAEAQSRDGRQTQWNFLPEPGKEIATEFGRILPDHVLRDGAGPGINPRAPRLMGIGWVDCDCTVNFDQVFNFASPHNDGAGETDVKGYVAYAYTYVEVLGGEPLEAFISFSSDDAAEVLLGPLPLSSPGLESVYLVNLMRGALAECQQQDGPGGETPTPKVSLGAGLNLLLVKILEGPGDHLLRFRLRNTKPPYPPLLGDDIRIRLRPDLEAPDPPVFLRGDATGDGEVNLSDAVLTLGWLFRGGEEPRCQDAADADDDGSVSLSDAVYTLQHLFQGGAALPFPRGCCGLDPTWDDLPECAADVARCRRE